MVGWLKRVWFGTKVKQARNKVQDVEVGHFDRYGRLHVSLTVFGQHWTGWLEPAE